MAGPNQDFLGTGWSFPVRFSRNGKEVVTYSGVEKVHSSIWIILNTRLGERTMLEDFGAGLANLQFEPLKSRLVNDLKSRIGEAILLHEPRVRLDQVDVSIDPEQDGLLRIKLSYTVRSNNSRFNLVYPFYVNEGT